MGTGDTDEDVGELALVPGRTERRGVLGLALQVTCGCPAVGHHVLASVGVCVCPPQLPQMQRTDDEFGLAVGWGRRPTTVGESVVGSHRQRPKVKAKPAGRYG